MEVEATEEGELEEDDAPPPPPKKDKPKAKSIEQKAQPVPASSKPAIASGDKPKVLETTRKSGTMIGVTIESKEDEKKQKEEKIEAPIPAGVGEKEKITEVSKELESKSEVKTSPAVVANLKEEVASAVQETETVSKRRSSKKESRRSRKRLSDEDTHSKKKKKKKRRGNRDTHSISSGGHVSEEGEKVWEPSSVPSHSSSEHNNEAGTEKAKLATVVESKEQASVDKMEVDEEDELPPPPPPSAAGQNAAAEIVLEQKVAGEKEKERRVQQLPSKEKIEAALVKSEEEIRKRRAEMKSIADAIGRRVSLEPKFGGQSQELIDSILKENRAVANGANRSLNDNSIAVLNNLVAQHESSDKPETLKIVHENNVRFYTAKQNAKMLPLYHQPSDAPCWRKNAFQHEHIKAKVKSVVEKRKNDWQQKLDKLIVTYTSARSKWLKKQEKSTDRKTPASKKRSSKAGRATGESGAKDGSGVEEASKKSTRYPSRTVASMVGSDFVGSEWEQEARLKEILENERREKDRILNAASLPDMIIPEEARKRTVFNTSNNRLTTDGAQMQCAHVEHFITCTQIATSRLRNSVNITYTQPSPNGCNCPAAVEEMERLVNPWTDIEKCIFIDKFLQYPKNFYKISTFLRNKSTNDVVQFYYDTKKICPYKQLLIEQHQRRKVERKPRWELTALGAKHLGIKFPKDLEDTKSKFFVIDESGRNDEPRDPPTKKGKKHKVRKRDEASSAEPPEAKVPKVYPNPLLGQLIGDNKYSVMSKPKPVQRPRRAQADEQVANPTKSVPVPSAVTAPNVPPPKTTATARSGMTKWAENEKADYVKLLQIYGKNWKKIAELIPSKSVNQVKNYYQNYKIRLGLQKIVENREQALAHSSKQARLDAKKKSEDAAKPKATAKEPQPKAAAVKEQQSAKVESAPAPELAPKAAPKKAKGETAQAALNAALASQNLTQEQRMMIAKMMQQGGVQSAGGAGGDKGAANVPIGLSQASQLAMLSKLQEFVNRQQQQQQQQAKQEQLLKQRQELEKQQLQQAKQQQAKQEQVIQQQQALQQRALQQQAKAQQQLAKANVPVANAGKPSDAAPGQGAKSQATAKPVQTLPSQEAKVEERRGVKAEVGKAAGSSQSAQSQSGDLKDKRFLEQQQMLQDMMAQENQIIIRRALQEQQIILHQHQLVVNNQDGALTPQQQQSQVQYQSKLYYLG